MRKIKEMANEEKLTPDPTTMQTRS